MSRVLVVGAGVGGLAVAARLACQGHRVTVLEAADTVGGKLGSLEREGFCFDTGPSLLTMPAVFEDLFAATGGWPDDLKLERLDPVARYRFADDTTFDASNDLDELCRRLDAALGEGAGDDWRGLLDRARKIWRASRTPFLESALHGSRTLAALTLKHPGDLATLSPGRSLRALGRRHLHDPRLRMVLDRYATYSGSDPRRAPAALAAIPYVEQAYGGWYVTGGLRRLADALLQRALDVGVEIRTHTRVVAIHDPATSVRLEDGSEVAADLVVANVDATHVYGDLVDCPSAKRKLARAMPSLSGFMLLLAVSGRSHGQAHHTVLFPQDYDAEFDAVFGRHAQPVPDPTLYVSTPPDQAPEGNEAWFVLVNAPRHGTGTGAIDWRAPGLAEAYADQLLDVLDRRGMPVRDRLLWREVITPADLQERTGAVGGAIYGTSSNGATAAFLRPANRSPVPGLFLVGGSSHPGGGLPLVALSAQIVSRLIGPA
ncbi:MAG: Phytoene desaturase [Frankiales bacterium]|nr:Phytoene desaturase [Frankiales bacterium]